MAEVCRWTDLDAMCFDMPSAAFAGEVRRSSEGLPWLGLRVWHHVGPPGELHIPPIPYHTIVLRRAGATHIVQRHGERLVAGRWQAGECVVVPAGVPSFWCPSAPRDNIHIDLDPAWLRRSTGADVDVTSCFGRNDPVLAAFAHTLLASLDSNTSLHPSFAQNMALALALHLAENYARPGRVPAATGSLTARQMRALQTAIAQGLEEPWPVARMAALAGLSPFHFSRSFKAAFGTTPHAYVSLQRMEAAARMIREERKSVAEVARAAGHPSAAHFTQAFRRHWGLTPTEFRNRC